MVGTEADHKDQRDAADHTYDLLAAAWLLRQVVCLGHGVEFKTQDGVTHQDGDHWDAVTHKDCTDQYGGDVVHLLKVGVLHTGDVAIILHVGQRHSKKREGLHQDQEPDSDTDVAHITDPPEAAEPQGQNHSDEAVNAEAGHEVDSGVCVYVEEKAWNFAQSLRQRPVEAQSVVEDPQRQRQSKEDVGDDQVEGIQGGGVHFLQIRTDDVEGQAVSKQTHYEDGAVKNRHEDAGVVSVAVQSGAGGVAVVVCERVSEGLKFSGVTHLWIWGSSDCKEEKTMCDLCVGETQWTRGCCSLL